MKEKQAIFTFHKFILKGQQANCFVSSLGEKGEITYSGDRSFYYLASCFTMFQISGPKLWWFMLIYDPSI
jgi:hypothetical protein